MCDGCILQAGVEAADALLEDVFRVPIEKALNPLDLVAFVTLIRRVARSLRLEVSPIEQQAVEEAAKIMDANWPDMTKAQREAKLAEIEELLAETGKHTLPGIRAIFDTNADNIIEATRKGLVKKFDLSISATMTERDEVTSKRLRETESLFVRDNYGKVAEKLSAKARDIVAAGLEAGLGRDDISGDLAKAMKEARRPNAYWNLIATTFSNRARNFTQVHGLDEAGIRAFAVSAILDEVTSDVCRFLDGKEFPVEQSVKRIKQVQESNDPEAIVDMMPWISKGKNDDGQDILYYKKGDQRRTVCVIEESGEGERDKIGTYSDAVATETLTKAGIGMPPYHGSCRTTIIPVF